jgi:thiol-disulfide isomerase/thioredoxin
MGSVAVIAVAVLSALAGFAAVYGTLGRPDNKSNAATSAALATPHAPDAAPTTTTKGSLVAFVRKSAPEALPDIAFADAQGASKSLKDFNGKVVLLNLWATWCAPCREEMPSLDRLQKELGSDKFEVVALAVDRGGTDAARKFLDTIKVGNLAVYADKTARSASTLRALGMPTTILIDKGGREIGRLPGPAEWDSPDAKTLIETALAQ